MEPDETTEHEEEAPSKRSKVNAADTSQVSYAAMDVDREAVSMAPTDVEAVQEGGVREREPVSTSLSSEESVEKSSRPAENDARMEEVISNESSSLETGVRILSESGYQDPEEPSTSRRPNSEADDQSNHGSSNQSEATEDRPTNGDEARSVAKSLGAAANDSIFGGRKRKMSNNGENSGKMDCRQGMSGELRESDSYMAFDVELTHDLLDNADRVVGGNDDVIIQIDNASQSHVRGGGAGGGGETGVTISPTDHTHHPVVVIQPASPVASGSASSTEQQAVAESSSDGPAQQHRSSSTVPAARLEPLPSPTLSTAMRAQRIRAQLMPFIFRVTSLFSLSC